jgi:hypothetical protein
VVAVQEDVHGELPSRLIDPLAADGSRVTGEWALSGRDVKRRVAIYQRVDQEVSNP